MRQFHEIITERRQEMGLTVENVHERLERLMLASGKKPPAIATVGHWFNGTRKRPRDMEQLRGLCSVLDLQVGEAMGGDPLQPQTAMEQLILQKVRGLNIDDQELAVAFLERLGSPRLESGPPRLPHKQGKDGS